MTKQGAIVVTGGSNGIGYFVSEQLAEAGRKVIIAARNADRARSAIAAIRSRVPEADLRFQELDLGSLASIARQPTNSPGLAPSRP